MDEHLGPLRERLADRYRIEGELGHGGHAVVYRAWNLKLGRPEALKVLAPRRGDDEDFRPRFMQEVRLAAGLEHPSIVKVYDFGETGGTCWYSMQLVDGETLAGRLRHEGTVDEREAARIALPLLDALAYSHARGIVHRDLKPENVILDAERRPYLMDFGIAKSAGSLVKTQTGFLMGTPAYVSPEQAQARPLDGRTDLYALGVTLYRIVSGRYPFEAPDPLGAVILRLTQPPRPLAEVFPGVDPAFASIVMRALERDPAARWPRARTMREAFEAFLAGRPVAEASAAPRGPELPRPSTVEPPEAATSGPTVFAPVATAPEPTPARASTSRVITSPLGAPPRRSIVLYLAAGFAAVVVLLGLGSLLFLPRRRSPAEEAPGRSVPSLARPAPTAASAAAPAATPTPPAPAPVPPPAAEPAVPRARAAARPEPRTTAPPPEPAARRPVTAPERLTPEPPFEGTPPAGCSGAAITVGFSVDEAGTIVAPRLFPSGAPAECGRFVLDTLPRWKWRPAVDASGQPAPSARLVVYVRLP